MLVSDENVEKIEPLGLFEAKSRRSPAVVMALYSGQPFSVELVVPPGFRGMIKASVQFRDDLPCPIGQRVFTYRVDSGSVQLIGPAILRRLQPAKYVVKYTDGIELVSGRADASRVVCHWLKHEGSWEYFAVGSEAEIAQYRRDLFPVTPESPAPSSSSRGGKGGKGGRGGSGAFGQ
jgi:hypothetical protein